MRINNSFYFKNIQAKKNCLFHVCCTKTRTLMASSPGIRDCDKVGIQFRRSVWCVLVETSLCEYY